MKTINEGTGFGSEGGFALVLTILVMLVVGTLTTGAVIVGGNNVLASRYYDRANLLDVVANGGMELARATLNGDPSIYPDSGYVTLENGAAVRDGAGDVIPGVKRWIYVGPTGVTSGQYGIFGSIVAVVRDEGGGEVIRRSLISQQSFARFVYFTNSEGSVQFNGDNFWGPLHSNDKLTLTGWPSIFNNEVTTARTIVKPNLGTFVVGYEENVAPIPMPTTAEISKLQAQAAAGGTAFTGDTNGNTSEASLRIEFVAIDLNGDGDTTDSNEGFFKVYRSSNVVWLSAYYTGDVRTNPNCGRWVSGTFVPMLAHPVGTVNATTASQAVGAQCYLGGDSLLTGGFDPTGDGQGTWLPWTGTQAPGLSGRPDAGYLWPLARVYNPNFKGVISVAGKVGVSGVVRGNVTVVATNDIIILDDLQYATNPGAGTCQDIVGLFAGNNITMAHNYMNAAQRPFGTRPWKTYDDTGDEFVDAVILALNQFGAAEWNAGAAVNENCQGNPGGRGCLFLTGGIIQNTRGAVGGSVTGYWKRYSWDACAVSSPPPYFPTTGHFSKGQYYRVDPAGFSVSGYFAALTPGS